MENKIGPWIIRYSDGNMYSYYGAYKDAERIAQNNVNGTEVIFIIV